MHSWMIRRAALVSELRLAHEESARLNEMIPVLQAAHVLNGSGLRELVHERRSVFHRALALHKALRKLDETHRNERADAAVGAQRSAA